jgi:hypothetical protein
MIELEIRVKTLHFLKLTLKIWVKTFKFTFSNDVNLNSNAQFTADQQK